MFRYSATCLSFSIFLCVVGRDYLRKRGGGGWLNRWWLRSRITRPRESPALYTSFNTLCVRPYPGHFPWMRAIQCNLLIFIAGNMLHENKALALRILFSKGGFFPYFLQLLNLSWSWTCIKIWSRIGKEHVLRTVCTALLCSTLMFVYINLSEDVSGATTSVASGQPVLRE